MSNISTPNGDPNPDTKAHGPTLTLRGAFAKVMLIICGVEFGIMTLFQFLPAIPDWAESLLDTSLLGLFSFPMLWVMVIRPLHSSFFQKNREVDSLFDGSPEPLIFLDAGLKPLAMNSAAKRHLESKSFSESIEEKLKGIDAENPEMTCGETWEFALPEEGAGHKRIFRVYLFSVHGVESAPLPQAKKAPSIATWLLQLVDETEAEERRKKIAAQENLWRAFLESAPALTRITDRRGFTTYVNQHWLHFTGHELGQELGDGWKECLHPLDADDFLHELEAHMARHAPFEGTVRVYNSAGEIRWLQDHWNPIVGSEGEFLGYVGAATDITQVKLSESMAKASEEKFRIVFDYAPIGLIKVDASFHFLSANEAFCSWLGYSREELLEKSIFDITYPDDIVTSNDDTGESRKEDLASFQKIRSMDKRYVTKTGEVVWGRVTSRPILDGDGGVKKTLSCVEDITEVKRLENENESQKLLVESQNMALNAAAIVSATDAEGKITYVNDKFSQISGYSKEELIGKSHNILSSKTHDPGFFASMWQTIAQGKIWKGEICNRSKNGELYWVDTTVVPFMDRHHKVDRYFSVRFDITQRRLAEQSLVHSAKMSSLGEMAGGVAHEINNPLAIIAGNASQIHRMLSLSPVPIDKVAERVERIEKTSFRIARIVKGLRTFSRDAEQDPFEVVPLGQVVDDAMELCQEKFKSHGVGLVKEIEEGLYLRCRSTQISQVLLNLMNNAHDATEPLEERWVRVEGKRMGVTLRLAVMDSGKGIPKEVADKIMQPFFTTKPVGKGTGLGLSISRGICDSHGGTLRYVPDAPHTCFEILLPLADAQSASPSPEEMASGSTAA